MAEKTDNNSDRDDSSDFFPGSLQISESSVFELFDRRISPFLDWRIRLFVTLKVSDNVDVLIQRDEKGDTLLHKVCEYWDEDKEDWRTLDDFFQIFIRHKVDLNSQNNAGETPIMIAINKGQILLTAHFFPKVDLSICDYEGNSVLHKAVMALHLHNFYAVGNWHDFVIRSESPCINYDPCKKNNQNLTALQLAVKMKEDLEKKCSQKEIEVSKDDKYDLSTLQDMVIFLRSHVSQL